MKLILLRDLNLLIENENLKIFPEGASQDVASF
jgi:hypothetical protein